MKKLLLLLASCCMTMSSAIGATWKKVTSETDLTLDGEYIIACAQKGQLMGHMIGSNKYLPAVEYSGLTESTTEITELPANTAIVKFEGDAWTAVTLHIYAEDGTTSKGYYKTSEAKKMSLVTTAGTPASVKFDSNNSVITFGQNGSLYCNVSSDPKRFLNYTSTGQQKVQLFKKDATAPDDTRASLDPKLSFTKPTVSLDINDGKTVTAQRTNHDELTFTWSSNNTDVATINETDGTITIKATGNTTIRADFAGNDDFKPDYAEYKLVVTDKNAQVVTFDFTTETYGMVRHTSGSGYNDDPFAFGDGWIIVKTTGKNRLWKTDGLRVYTGAIITIYAPEGCTLTSVKSNRTFTIDTEKKKATYKHNSSSNSDIPQIEVTYAGVTNDDLATAFRTGNSLSVTVNGQPCTEGTFQKTSAANAEVSLANIYPHAKIYYKWTAASPQVTLAETGDTEYTAPLSLDSAGTLEYYAVVNGVSTDTKTLTVTGPTTTGISEIEAEGAATEWFDLSGRRVAAPAKGVYLRKQGATVTKIAY